MKQNQMKGHMQGMTFQFQQLHASIGEHCPVLFARQACKANIAFWCRAIPLTDRLTMLPLLYSILDYDRSPASFERYDKMSAWDLFQRSAIAHADCH